MNFETVMGVLGRVIFSF